MKIRINILSPLHIGSGEAISPSEYYIDQQAARFIRLNMNALISSPSFEPYREKFITEASKQRYIGSIIKDTILLQKFPRYSIPIRGESKTYLANNQTTVKDFVKTAGRVYIPGSSLKGAILSGMIWRTILELFQKNPTYKRRTLVDGKVFWKEVEADDFIREALTGPMRYEEFSNFVFSYFSHDTKADRFLQWINVSDTSYASPEGSLEISLAEVKGARRGGELPILYETIQPGSSFTGEISVKNLRLSEDEVLETAHRFYVKVLERDNAPISKEPYLLRLGQGSTAFSTSLIIAAEELGMKNYRVKPPRTRKRIDENTPMAWVRICPQKGN